MTRSEAPVRSTVGNPTLGRSILAVVPENSGHEVEKKVVQRRKGRGVNEMTEDAKYSVCIVSEPESPI